MYLDILKTGPADFILVAVHGSFQLSHFVGLRIATSSQNGRLKTNVGLGISTSTKVTSSKGGSGSRPDLHKNGQLKSGLRITDLYLDDQLIPTGAQDRDHPIKHMIQS